MCMGRRMADSAVHLEQSVLAAVLIRHWICPLPWGLRALLATIGGSARRS